MVKYYPRFTPYPPVKQRGAQAAVIFLRVQAALQRPTHHDGGIIRAF